MPKDENLIPEESTNKNGATVSSRTSGLGAGAITGIVIAGVAVLAATGLGGVAIGQTLPHNDRAPFSRDAERGHGHPGQPGPGMGQFGDRDGDGGHHRRDRDGGQDDWMPQGGLSGDGQMMPQGPGGMSSQPSPPPTMTPQGTMPQGAPQLPPGGLNGINGWSGGS